MSDERYHGWTNFETFLINLFAETHEPSSSDRRQLAQRLWNETPAHRARAEHANTLELANGLEAQRETITH